jgi:hypothetical protein
MVPDMSRLRLAILSTHPIQYHAPWLALATHPALSVRVFFHHGEHDVGMLHRAATS